MKVFSKIVYHGSGANFDKFDLSFMGSGEGAQVHGWGIYLTESKDIAKNYAETSSANSGSLFIFKDGTSYEMPSEKINTHDYEDLKKVLIKHGWQYTNDALIKTIFKYPTLDKYVGRIKFLSYEIKDEDWRNRVLHNMELIESGEIQMKPLIQGMIATVEIPDNFVFAKERITIDEQPEIVRNAILKICSNVLPYVNYNSYHFPNVSSSLSTLIFKYIQNKKAIDEVDTIKYLFEEWNDNNDGEEITPQKLADNLYDVFKYNQGIEVDNEILIKLSESLIKYADKYKTTRKYWENFGNWYESRADDEHDNGEHLSKQLSSLGVDGIEYDGEIDGHCYVVFNPEDLIITQKE